MCVCYDIQNENSGSSPAVLDLRDQGDSLAGSCFSLVPVYLSQVKFPGLPSLLLVFSLIVYYSHLGLTTLLLSSAKFCWSSV